VLSRWSPSTTGLSTNVLSLLLMLFLVFSCVACNSQFPKTIDGKFLKGALTQTQKFGCCSQKKWIWSTTFFSFCEQSHMLACDHFLFSIDKKMCRWKLFFWVSPIPSNQNFKKSLDQIYKNWKSHRLKIRNIGTCCSARKRKIHRQKKLSETWIDSRLFSFSTVDFRQCISAPCFKKLPAHF